MKISLENYKELIDKYNHISFDVFDTLLLRDVLLPKDIFKIIEKQTNIDNFFQKRVVAEQRARKKALNNECNFDDIYSEIKDIDFNIEQLKEIEKNIEKKFLKRNPFMYEVYSYALANKKDIYILTDMYLDKKFIEELLLNLGYDGYIKMYVSNDIKKSKSKRDMYKLYLKENKLDPKDCLHIGDNYISDVKNANSLGIYGVEYESVLKRSKSNKVESVGLSIMQAIVANNYYNGLKRDYYESVGAKIVSPLIFSTTLWLKDLLVGSKSIYFLSRDGRLPYEVFNILKEKMNLNIESKYIYTSRKAYQIPTLILEHKNIFIDYLTSNSLFEKTKTVGDYLSFIDKKYLVDIESQLVLFGLNSLDENVDSKNIHFVKKLISHLYDKIEEQMYKEIDLLKKYFKQEGLLEKENINLFDIGWRGSIQNSIRKILPDKNINGYYLGTSMSVYEPLMSNTYGYLFDLAVPYKNFRKTFDNIMMYELFFSSPEPTLELFEEKEGKIVPKFIEKETEQYKYIEKIHKGVIDSANLFVDYLEYINSNNIIREEVLSITNDFIVRKDFEDMEKFKVFKSNIGLDDRYFSFVETYNKEYVENNKSMFIKEIENSLWKNSFLIDGIDNKEEYNQFLKKHKIKRAYKNKKIFNKKNILKGLKNPKKGFLIMKRLINES